jgi:hypothetical protein
LSINGIFLNKGVNDKTKSNKIVKQQIRTVMKTFLLFFRRIIILEANSIKIKTIEDMIEVLQSEKTFTMFMITKGMKYNLLNLLLNLMR